jgi:hypothetical protein
VIAIAAALPLHAVDGVVLINQNAALAGNVTPGDTPGFPVTISVAGSYRLSGNLTVPDANTTAIQIVSDNVTIDLNGFSIIGPTVCSGTPVTSCNPFGLGSGVSTSNSNIFVSNGTIRGLGFKGVNFFAGGQQRVEKVNAISNGVGGIKVGSGSVASCTATNNGQHGIEVIGIAIDNTAEFNGGDGIRVEGVAANNTAISSAGAGLNGSVVVAAGNHTDVILADCPSVLVSNQAGAISATGSSGCVVVNNSQ